MSSSSVACIFCGDGDGSGSVDREYPDAGGGASTNYTVEGYGQYASVAPTPTPLGLTSSSSAGKAFSTPQPMDILASVFFVVAAAWLLIALLYAVLAMTFLRIRARGNLDRIYDEDFGRVRLFGNVHLRFGWLLRRYIQHMMRADRPGSSSMSSLTRFMTREERRLAMKAALGIESSTSSRRGKCAPAELVDLEVAQSPDINQKECDVEAPSSPSQGDPSMLDEEPVCSICLGGYEDEDGDEEGGLAIFQSKTCPHRFHSECILDWLQRQANLECPCCRVAMVEEDDVWKAVKRLRRDRKKQLKRERRSQRIKQRGEDAQHSTQPPESTESSSSSSTDESEGDLGIVVLPNPSTSSAQSLSAGREDDLEGQIQRREDSSTVDDDDRSQVINV